MKKYFGLFLLLGTLVACDKDKFETKPQLTLKSINTNEVPYNGNLVVTLEFTDKEGDVNDSLFVIRERLNVRGPFVAAPSPFKIPNFPERNQGEMQINFDFQTQLISGLPSIRIPGTVPSQYEPDSLILKFVARDKEGNLSDTLTVNDIFVQRL